MSIIVTDLDVKKNLTVHTAIGGISKEDFLEKIREHYSDKATKRVLWDIENAQIKNITFAEIYDFSNQLQNYSDHERKVALVCANPFENGILKMLKIILDMSKFHSKIYVTETKEDALRWLFLEV